MKLTKIQIRKHKIKIARINSIKSKSALLTSNKIEQAILNAYRQHSNIAKVEIKNSVYEKLIDAVTTIFLSDGISLTDVLFRTIPKLYGYTLSPRDSKALMDKLIKDYRKRFPMYAESMVGTIKKSLDGVLEHAIVNGIDSKATNKLIKEAFERLSTTRSKLAAQLVTGDVVNVNLYTISKKAGATQKLWVYTYAAKKPRQHHMAYDGSVVKIDEDFVIGNYTCKYPHDTSLPISEKANCHCVCSYI